MKHYVLALTAVAAMIVGQQSFAGGSVELEKGAQFLLETDAGSAIARRVFDSVPKNGADLLSQMAQLQKLNRLEAADVANLNAAMTKLATTSASDRQSVAASMFLRDGKAVLPSQIQVAANSELSEQAANLFQTTPQVAQKEKLSCDETSIINKIAAKIESINQTVAVKFRAGVAKLKALGTPVLSVGVCGTGLDDYAAPALVNYGKIVDEIAQSPEGYTDASGQAASQKVLGQNAWSKFVDGCRIFLAPKGHVVAAAAQ
jgi:hypothetical protein